MKRAVAFAFILFITASTLYAAAQPKKPAAPAPKSAEGGAPTARDERDGGAPIGKGGVVEQKTDGGSKVFRFGEVEVEGEVDRQEKRQVQSA